MKIAIKQTGETNKLLFTKFDDIYGSVMVMRGWR